MEPTIEEQLAILATAGPIEATQESAHQWLCKHEDGMIKRDNTIIAYFMYYPTREIAIKKYFDYLTEENTSILLRDNLLLREFKFNGTAFVKIDE